MSHHSIYIATLVIGLLGIVAYHGGDMLSYFHRTGDVLKVAGQVMYVSAAAACVVMALAGWR